ncbi:MAG: response regulator, partial [Methylobacteriaceae bacterium]|nr:response regulator [Methylobacteriaceae bacterium]
MILIVEDECSLREVTAECLRDAGLIVHEARDGVEAAAILEDRAGDLRLVLTDTRLPGRINGLELARLSRRKWPWLKLVMTSGVFDIPEASLPPGTIFLKKPWASETLLGTVAACLGEEKFSPKDVTPPSAKLAGPMKTKREIERILLDALRPTYPGVRRIEIERAADAAWHLAQMVHDNTNSLAE